MALLFNRQIAILLPQMKVLLNAKQIEQALKKLAADIVSDTREGVEVAVIGIRSRGEILAQRLAGILSEKISSDVPCGTLDITLYRDDINSPQGNQQPKVRTTEIGFDINDKIIVLVDEFCLLSAVHRLPHRASVDRRTTSFTSRRMPGRGCGSAVSIP